MFAKPFICALDGHNDGVHVLAKHPSRLSTVLSGALDGQVKIWLLSNKKCLTTIQAHNGPINGNPFCSFIFMFTRFFRSIRWSRRGPHLLNSRPRRAVEALGFAGCYLWWYQRAASFNPTFRCPSFDFSLCRLVGFCYQWRWCLFVEGLQVIGSLQTIWFIFASKIAWNYWNSIS